MGRAGEFPILYYSNLFFARSRVAVGRCGVVLDADANAGGLLVVFYVVDFRYTV